VAPIVPKNTIAAAGGCTSPINFAKFQCASIKNPVRRPETPTIRPIIEPISIKSLLKIS
jgi:hypothetical protein